MTFPSIPLQACQRTVTSEIDCGLSCVLDGPCDFIFSVHATLGMGQTVLSESIVIDPPLSHRVNTDPQSGNRLMRLHAEAGPLSVRYRATVERRLDATSTCTPARSPSTMCPTTCCIT